MMVGKNTAIHETPFTISVDLLGHGCTTGISAHDRFKTIKALAAPETKKEELGRPGHIFPLMARIPDLRKVADKFGLVLVSIKDLIAYRMKTESQVVRQVTVNMPTTHGDF